jgi:hypothetical protein
MFSQLVSQAYDGRKILVTYTTQNKAISEGSRLHPAAY